MSEMSLLPATVGIVFYLFVVVLSVYVPIKLLRFAVRWLRWSAKNAGIGPAANLICFAIAAYIYPNPLRFILSAAWTIVTVFVTKLPTVLQQQLTSIQQSCSSLTDDACLNSLPMNLMSIWVIFLSDLFERINMNNFPLLDAILLTAVWLGLAGVWNWSAINDQFAPKLDRFFSRIRDAYNSISTATRSNFFFFVVLAVGAYLSLTAIIAIPSLQEPESLDKVVKSDELRQRLQSIALIDADFDKRFPLQISDENRLEKNPQWATAQKQSSSTDVGMWVIPIVKDRLVRLGNMDRSLQDLRENFRADQQKLINAAVEVFDLSNRGRKGIRETQQHFLNIDLWYQRWWAQRASQLSQCKSNIERYSADITFQFDVFFPAIRLASQAPPSASPQGPLASASPQVLTELLNRGNQLETEASRSCSDPVEYFGIPDRADFGGYLGIFGATASWLLKTESLSLVLITGLLGFGLLGAACSTLIRNVVRRAPGEPLVPNLASIVIRGASAAILIFLAVYGGLAVFAGANTNPNPYVVLFTCLVAAVFSEDAWAWGQQEFRSRLSRNREGKRRDAGHAPRQ
jgi:hypothetical protein